MGIAVQELLANEYFKDFHVIAGRKGLNKEIQGVTLLEAPDGPRWTRGKELILSSGYVIQQEPDCISTSFREGSLQQISAMMIKRERYLDTIPEDIITLFDQYEIPLISMPFSIAWMELMNQLNTVVMNRTVRRFRVHTNSVAQVGNQSYKEQKIRKILQAVEMEMNFPAFLHDLVEEKDYYSSSNFKTITKSFGLTNSDYWEPSRPYTRYTLCDTINMARIRLINQDNVEGPRVSWIIIPIELDGIIQAYFVVMESREFIDYYDEYSLRIAFLMLQDVYEQIMITQHLGNVGFENFIHFALDYQEKDAAKLFYQANIQGISVYTPYDYIIFHQCNEEKSARSERSLFIESFQKSRLGKFAKIIFLDENEGVSLAETDLAIYDAKTQDAYFGLLREFGSLVTEKCAGMQLVYALCREGRNLQEIRECVSKCQKTLKMGQIIFPDRDIWEYSMLGPLAWFEVPANELENLLKEYRDLLIDEKNRELLITLKFYLENNMNY
ncbi:MAG: PucR family transcriptional regulator ligand-binding domain-containing protein, partial [Clostridiales bacterium]|nr:PucR family transcriptional regulator ligand-binding domain-containing protein [Clostridiales bacterium]